MTKEGTKKTEDYVKKINELITFYNNYQDDNVTKESIEKTKDELFTRIFTKKDVKSINSDMEIELPGKKNYKLKEYNSLEEVYELLDNAKDAFSFLIYDKNKKEGHVLDIVGFIILSLIAIGFIYAGKIVIGIVFLVCFVSLYLVTFTNKKKSSHK